MSKELIIAAALMLNAGDNAIAGDDSSGPTQPPSHPAQVSMKAADWNLLNANINAHPSQLGEAWKFDFAFSESPYLVTTASPVLVQGWYVKISAVITSPPGT